MLLLDSSHLIIKEGQHYSSYLAALPIAAMQMGDQQQNWSPVSHSSGGSFLKIRNYFKHITVFETMQFYL